VAMKAESGLVRLEVFNPLSEIVVDKSQKAARLETLHGKTICEAWETGDFAGEKTFPVIRELLKKRFPEIQIVPYTEIPRASLKGTPSYQRQVLSDIIAVLKRKGAQAVIAGNGG